MTEFLFDTNVASELSRPHPAFRVTHWIEGQMNDAMFLSVITIGEIRKGAALLPQSHRRASLENWIQGDLLNWFQDRILPVTFPIADRWGRFDASSQLIGRPLNAADWTDRRNRARTRIHAGHAQRR
jgi:toxin FitB